MKQLGAALLTGFLFGLGLTISQMSNPEKVLAFLDVTGAWDPSLLIVMGCAVLTTLIGYRWVLQRTQPIFDAEFSLPTSSLIDARLLGGAALFGIGWGLAGYCPGPVIAALPLGAKDAWLVLVGILTGFWLQRRLG